MKELILKYKDEQTMLNMTENERSLEVNLQAIKELINSPKKMRQKQLELLIH
jgi:hypothetical protein